MGRRLRQGGGLALAIACAGCALVQAPERDGVPGAIAISFETQASPQAFFVEGPAVSDGPDGVPGYWAAVPRLPRPERAKIVNLDTGASVEAALFAGGRAGAPIRLSGAVAETLRIGADPAPVRITALRREPRLVAP